MIEYKPKILGNPNTAKVSSLWYDTASLLEDIIQTFNIKTDLALEFGVFKGYSTSALACYFKRVIGVDTFLFDPEEIWDKYLTCFKDLKD